MNLQKTYNSIVNSTKELRTEASRLTLLADTLESAKKLLGISPMVAEAAPKMARKLGNTGNRLTPSKREQMDEWLAKGEKSIREIVAALGITRARAYQRRSEMGLDTYKRHSVGAGK